MVYTHDQLRAVALELQCCIAKTAYQYMVAESLDPNCGSRLRKNIDLKFIYDMIMDHEPIGYEFPNGYVQTANDQCVTDTDIDNIIQLIVSECGCACCTDPQDLIKDI